MKKKTRTLAVAVALASQALWGALTVVSAPASPGLDQRVRESERKQQMIRTSTQRIGEDLSAIITEFENNGMGEGEDVKVLRAIKSVLGKLSDKEMARVIELLGAARGQDSNKTRSTVAEAFGGQKTIVVELRQLLLEYERQQELYELSLRFAQLANRQNGNLKEAKRLVRSAMNKTADRFDDNQKISLTVQKDEETAIRDEAVGILNKLGALASDTQSTTAERLSASLQAAKKGRLEESLRSAVEELKGGTFYRAATSEQNARNQLRELSRLVAPPKEAQEILRQAAAELERLVIEQKATIVQTQGLAEAGRKNEEAYFEAEDREGDIVDRTHEVWRDIEHLCPLGADQCKKAEDDMQQSRATILEKRRSDAVKNQEQAVLHLDAARKLVLEALEKQEKKEQAPVDKLAQAKALKEKVAALKEEQEKLKGETEHAKELPTKNAQKQNEQKAKLAELSPEQSKLQDQARNLQPETANSSVPAADAIAEAAREMGKAQVAIDKAAEKKDNKLEQATAPQQAAVENLARAEKLLDKEIADLEQAKGDLDQLQKARDKVAELIKNENKIEIATGKAEAMQNPQKGATPATKNPDGAKPQDAQNGGTEGAQPPANADAKNNDAQNAQANDTPKNADSAKPQDAGSKRADAPKNAANDAAAKEQAKALAPDQGKNAEATADAAAGLPQSAQDAAAPLNESKSNQEQAKGDLQKGDATGARPDEKKALANLEKAKDAIDKKINDLQNQLGQPADAQAAANADLAQAIAKAQGDINQAMQQADGAQPAAQDPAQGNKPAGEQAQGEPAQGEKAQGEKAQGEANQGEKGQGQPAQGQAAQGEKGQKAPGKPQAQALAKTAEDLAAAAAQASAPAAVDAAISEATDALAQASGAAEAGDKPATQSNAASAQAALDKAAAALAMAQQGASSTAQANAQGQQGQGQEAQGQKGQGQGQQQGEGQGQGQGPQGKGQGDKGQGQGPSQSTTEGQGQGSGNRQSGHASASDNGQRGNNRGKGEFIKLPPRDRNAIMQSRKESAPSEYAPAVEQYLKNLSDSEDK
jgi:PAX-interacting protein 1